MPSVTVPFTDGNGRPRAVAVGFEPTNGLPRYTLSRNALLPTPSASSRYRPSSPEGSDRRLSVNCTQAEMQDICANDRRADFAKAMRGGWLKTSSTRFDDRALAQVTHLPAAGRFRWGEAPARPWSRRA